MDNFEQFEYAKEKERTVMVLKTNELGVYSLSLSVLLVQHHDVLVHELQLSLVINICHNIITVTLSRQPTVIQIPS
jgi:hypothetical protein